MANNAHQGGSSASASVTGLRCFFEHGPLAWICQRFRAVGAAWRLHQGRVSVELKQYRCLLVRLLCCGREGFTLAKDFPIALIFVFALTLGPVFFLIVVVYPLYSDPSATTSSSPTVSGLSHNPTAALSVSRQDGQTETPHSLWYGQYYSSATRQGSFTWYYGTVAIPCLAGTALFFLLATILCDPGVVSWVRRKKEEKPPEDLLRPIGTTGSGHPPPASRFGGTKEEREVLVGAGDVEEQQCVHTPHFQLYPSVGLQAATHTILMPTHGDVSPHQNTDRELHRAVSSSGSSSERESSGGGGGRNSHQQVDHSSVVLADTSVGRSLELADDPPGAAEDVHFCPVCLFHVEGFDHHCGVLGACIGSGNMCTFILFLLNVALLCSTGSLFVFARNWQLLLELPDAWKNRGIYFFFDAVICLGLTFVCMAATFGCGGLGCHYFWLTLTGQFSWARRHNRVISSRILPDRCSATIFGATISLYNVLLVFSALRQLRLAPLPGVVCRTAKGR